MSCNPILLYLLTDHRQRPNMLASNLTQIVAAAFNGRSSICTMIALLTNKGRWMFLNIQTVHRYEIKGIQIEVGGNNYWSNALKHFVVSLNIARKHLFVPRYTCSEIIDQKAPYYPLSPCFYFIYRIFTPYIIRKLYRSVFSDPVQQKWPVLLG